MREFISFCFLAWLHFTGSFFTMLGTCFSGLGAFCDMFWKRCANRHSDKYEQDLTAKIEAARRAEAAEAAKVVRIPPKGIN